MDSFDDKFWNLAQAAAWVVYREKELVTRFEQPTREGFMSLGLYSSMEPTSRQKFGSLRDLSLALTNERLQAWGCRANDDSHLEAIPSLEWPDLDLAPPLAYHAKNRAHRYQPWTDIRVESAAAKKLWRTPLEKDGRSNVAIEAADVILMSGDLRGVVNAFTVSQRTMSNIKQNLFWAFGYNTLLIPVAAGALYPLSGTMLSPVLAAGAMALSSVFVLTNALRLRWIKPAMEELEQTDNDLSSK
jgi:hypothetical protein